MQLDSSGTAICKRKYVTFLSSLPENRTCRPPFKEVGPHLLGVGLLTLPQEDNDSQLVHLRRVIAHALCLLLHRIAICFRLRNVLYRGFYSLTRRSGHEITSGLAITSQSFLKNLAARPGTCLHVIEKTINRWVIGVQYIQSDFLPAVALATDLVPTSVCSIQCDYCTEWASVASS
jgi:hypothetical protein